jgi:ribosomal protein L29
VSRHALRRLARLEGRLPRETCEALLRTMSDAELDGLIRRLRAALPPDEHAAAEPGAMECGMSEREEAATLAWLKAALAEIRREKGDG